MIVRLVWPYSIALLAVPGLTAEPKEGEGCLALATGSMEEGGLRLSTAAGSTEEGCPSTLSVRRGHPSTPGVTLMVASTSHCPPFTMMVST
jgi:hypothetical protein